jgi:hypothetical protein
MTLKEMLNQVLSETGFDQLEEFIGSTTQEARQLVALANREVNTLSKDEWQALRKDATITMTSANKYDLPADYRQFIPDTAWTETRKADFPTTDEVWQYYLARGVSSGLRHRVRIDGGQLEILDPSPGEVLRIFYISNAPVFTPAELFQKTFTADNDTLVLDDDLFMLGVIWRFMRAKGLEWQSAYQEYKTFYRSVKATDNSSQTLAMGEPSDEGPFPPSANMWL